MHVVIEQLAVSAMLTLKNGIAPYICTIAVLKHIHFWIECWKRAPLGVRFQCVCRTKLDVTAFVFNN